MLQHIPRRRHDRLFELIRQKNLSERTASRLRWRARPTLGPGETILLQSLTARSWRRPDSSRRLPPG